MEPCRKLPVLSPPVFLGAVLFLYASSSVTAQVHLTKEQALRQYFPDERTERKTLFLTDEQVRRIETHARTKLESKLVTYYVARTAQRVTGYAFFETHVVRTMPETFLVVVNPDSTVRAVEILAFYEPEDYLPPRRWLGLFGGKSLNDDLWVKRGVPPIVGATLSAQSITDGVRKILATYMVAIPKEN